MLNVSRHGYYKFIRTPPSKREESNNSILTKIKHIHDKSRKTYGSPRIHAALLADGESCSRKKVARLMKKSGIQAKMKKRFKITTKVNPKAKSAPNVLNRDFTAQEPNQSWVADITYIATAEGWLYVAAVLDLYSRRIVGLSMNERMTTNLVRSALEQALTHRQPQPGLMHHSDKGCQYTSIEFELLLKVVYSIRRLSCLIVQQAVLHLQT